MAEGAGGLFDLREGGLLVETELLRHDELLTVVLDADGLLEWSLCWLVAVAGRLALAHYIIQHIKRPIQSIHYSQHK